MDKKNIQAILQDELEKEIPASEIHLWQAVKANLVAGKIFQQGEKMNTIRSRRIRRISFAFVVVIALLTLAFITPQGRAFAQSILQFFTRAEADVLPAQSVNVTVPEEPRILSVEEAEDAAGFDVWEPASLPDEYTFEGASYTAEVNTVIQQFGYPADIRLSIKQQPFTTIEACDLCGLIGATAPVQTVQIGDLTGEYVEGVWELTDSGPVWLNDPYLKTLRWQTNDMAFEIVYMGLDLEKEALIVIAESMR